jgi:hypothetical protein
MCRRRRVVGGHDCLGLSVRMGWWLWNYDFESELWGKEVPN